MKKYFQFSLRVFLIAVVCISLLTVLIYWHLAQPSPVPATGFKKFDDIEWHDQGNKNDGNHIAFYLSWLVNKDELLCPELDDESLSGIDLLRKSELSPMSFLVDYYDRKLVSDVMSEQGFRFTLSYYEEYLTEFHSLRDSSGSAQKTRNNVESRLDKRYKTWKTKRPK